MDGAARVALIRSGTDVHPDDAGPAVRCELSDHLGSAALTLDATGNWTNREEYFPYGETSLGSFRRKRYRFTGKERDEESGLNYHGARYDAASPANGSAPIRSAPRKGVTASAMPATIPAATSIRVAPSPRGRPCSTVRTTMMPPVPRHRRGRG